MFPEHRHLSGPHLHDVCPLRIPLQAAAVVHGLRVSRQSASAHRPRHHPAVYHCSLQRGKIS